MTTNDTGTTGTQDAGAPRADGFTAKANAVGAKIAAILEPLVSRGAALADAGLDHVRRTVESGARALERAAKQLETLQERIKGSEPKPS